MIDNILIPLLFILSVGFKGGVKKEYHITGYAQGTTYHITYIAKDSVITKGQVDRVLNELDGSLSIYKPHSLISKFNNSASGIVTDKHLATVVKRSLEIYRDTHGSFDITVYPLVTAWGFGSKKVNDLPDSAAIKALLPCVGSQYLKLSGNRLTKTKPCVKIDVNGIAQGYSVDVVANYLEAKGIKNYLVEIGGELRVAGRKTNGELMKIGIESPAGNNFDEPVVSKVISIKSGAVTTSGDYRKYVESGGKRLSHLMDPKTGYSLKSDMVSVTVIAPDAITADGYDNPLMAMTIQQALTFIKAKKNMEAYFIYHKPNGALADTASAGFYKLLVK